jgi:hypothetical protein
MEQRVEWSRRLAALTRGTIPPEFALDPLRPSLASGAGAAGSLLRKKGTASSGRRRVR